MAKYKISGVWKDSKGEITHYAFHTVNSTGTTRGVKTTKADAIKIVANSSNEVVTWLWNYQTSFWRDGEKVHVVDGRYLRTNHDGTVKDNLSHLIDYDWLQQ